MSQSRHPLDQLARHLFELTTLLGISRQKVCGDEERTSLSLSIGLRPPEGAVGSEGFATALHHSLVVLAKLGDSALSLDFTIAGSPYKLISAAADLDFEAVQEKLVAELVSGNAVELSLSLDKDSLAKQYLKDEAVVPRFFLCCERLTEELSKPLPELEKQLAACQPGQKLLLLVALHDIALDGEYLSVVGGKYLDAWQTHSASRPSEPAVAGAVDVGAGGESTGMRQRQEDRPDSRPVLPAEMTEDAVDKVNWIDLHFATLTPLHLTVAPSAKDYDPEGCPIARALYSRLLDLCLAYAANQTRRHRKAASEKADDWIATFGSDDSLARVRFGSEAMAQGDVRLPRPFRAGVEKVREMVVWAYGGRRRDSDRLHALQNVVAQNLRGKPEEEAYAAIVSLAAEIERHRDWFWATYWEGKLNEYFDRVAKVMQFVDEVRKQYESQIQQLTKSLVDSALAGVGVVVGTFIAAMLKDSFDATVFRVGILLYAAYLFCFPGVLGLTNIWTQFREARSSFSQRAALFRAHLYERSVEGLLEPVAAAETRFQVWFWITAWIFFTISCLLILGALVGPLLPGLR